MPREAEPILRELLPPARRVLGPEHPSTLTAIHNLGAVLNDRQQYAEAEKLLAEANSFPSR
jgi:eukaryotic-like serine/threonine-protein kinase